MIELGVRKNGGAAQGVDHRSTLNIESGRPWGTQTMARLINDPKYTYFTLPVVPMSGGPVSR